MTALPFASVSFVESTGVQIIKAVVIFLFVLIVVPLILLLERKLLGRFQSRLGPNRVGPYGLLQPSPTCSSCYRRSASRRGPRCPG